VVYGNLINFAKVRLLYTQIAKLQQYQHQLHTFPSNGDLDLYVTDFVTPPEKDLYSFSLAREPRGESKPIL